MKKEQYKKAFQYFILRMRNLAHEKRAFVIMLILYIIIWEYTKGIREMIQFTGISITPYFFNFFMSDYLVSSGVLKILILAGYIMFMCDVSQKKEFFNYCVIRTGKKAWITGDLLFVGGVSFLYTCCICLFSILCFVPHISFEGDWGKIIGTLAYTDAGAYFAPDIIIPKAVLEMYSPAAATFLSVLLMFLGCTMLGTVIYFVNTLTGLKLPGPGIACFLIFLSPVVTYLRNINFHWISPVSWISIAELAPAAEIGYPPISYAVGMLLAIPAVMITVLYIYIKKIEIGGSFHE